MTVLILKELFIKEKFKEILDGLLIPSTKNVLVKLPEIYFDNMEDWLDEEVRENYIIAHRYINLDIAKELEIQTLSAKIFYISSDLSHLFKLLVNYAGDIDWEILFSY